MPSPEVAKKEPLSRREIAALLSIPDREGVICHCGVCGFPFAIASMMTPNNKRGPVEVYCEVCKLKLSV